MAGNRINILDFYRGYFIVSMIMVHMINLLSQNFDNYMIAEKYIVNIESAIEGFLLLVGLMVGMHYYKNYKAEPKKVNIRLLKRAGQIVILQYILIITVSCPLYYFIYHEKNMLKFLTSSLLFIDQLGIFHILPTFIPMFLISPVILFCFTKRLEKILLLSSIAFLLIGLCKPYLFNIGDKTIFPFIIYQFYFVIGCLLGKLILKYNKAIPNNINGLFVISIVFIMFMFIGKHGHHLFPHFLGLKLKYKIYFSKFPLTLSGFFYQFSLLFFLYTVVAKYWDLIKKVRVITPIFMLLGRHALLVFILHVYTWALIVMLTRLYNNELVTLLTIVMTLVFIIYITIRKDKALQVVLVQRELEDSDFK